MDCWWCHNPESRNSDPEEVICKRRLRKKEIDYKHTYGKSMAINELLDEIQKDRLFHEESGGGVTFSGGEPLYQPNALLQLLQLCKKAGMNTTVDTCGYAQWKCYEKIMPFTDLFLFDLKLLDAVKHEKFTGVKNELILTNLKKLADNRANLELRIPVIPGVNDSQEEINGLIRFILNTFTIFPKIHLLPYHNIAGNKYLKLDMKNRMEGVVKGEKTNLDPIKSQLESAGMKVGIGG